MNYLYTASQGIALALVITLFIFAMVLSVDKVGEKLKIRTKFELDYGSTFIITFLILSITMVYAFFTLNKYTNHNLGEEIEIHTIVE